MICDALRVVNDAQVSLSPGFRWGTTVLPGQDITMDNVMDQTCITYPETYRREMTGEEIKTILEDVCDNLFNKDPYYQQGGDMVRVGGLDYVCDPLADAGKRISAMTLDDGTPVEAAKKYVVAGWATVGCAVARRADLGHRREVPEVAGHREDQEAQYAQASERRGQPGDSQLPEDVDRDRIPRAAALGVPARGLRAPTGSSAPGGRNALSTSRQGGS